MAKKAKKAVDYLDFVVAIFNDNSYIRWDINCFLSQNAAVLGLDNDSCQQMCGLYGDRRAEVDDILNDLKHDPDNKFYYYIDEVELVDATENFSARDVVTDALNEKINPETLHWGQILVYGVDLDGEIAEEIMDRWNEIIAQNIKESADRELLKELKQSYPHWF